MRYFPALLTASLVEAPSANGDGFGYYARAAAPNQEDRALILKCAELAVDSALAGVSGCVGEDEDQGNTLRAIEFPRIKGGKHFNLATPWFTAMMAEIGQEVA